MEALSNLAELFEKATGLIPESIELMSGARTNSNYCISVGEKRYSMRVPGEGTNEYIDRKAEMANLRLVAAQFNFVPCVVYADDCTGLLISEYLEGARSMSAKDAKQEDVLRKVADRLAALHNSGIRFSNTFSLTKTKEGYVHLLELAQFSLPGELCKVASVLEDALAEYERCYSNNVVPCHGDPNLANFMERGSELCLIDWEYSGMCNRLFDVANMAMTDRLDETEEAALLQSYEQSSGIEINQYEYLLIKISIDYMWIFWHLIKLSQGLMVEYNEFSWRNRLSRALSNLRKIA